MLLSRFIYIYRERERDSYIYIYIERERERGREVHIHTYVDMHITRHYGAPLDLRVPKAAWSPTARLRQYGDPVATDGVEGPHGLSSGAWPLGLRV